MKSVSMPLNFVRRLSNSIRGSFALWLIQLGITVGSGSPFPKSLVPVLRDSGAVPTSSPNYQRSVWLKWMSANRLQVDGEYHEGVELKRELLGNLYSESKVNNEGYYPPNLSWDYSSNIGHWGWLLGHVLAQEQGLIPSGSRTLYVLPHQMPNNFLSIVSDRIQIVPLSLGARFGELPHTWPAFERLSMIKTLNSFVDDYQLFDGLLPRVDNGSGFSLSNEYVERARERLELLGLPRSAWFVCLHVRAKAHEFDHRAQELASYKLAVDEIIARGGWVIRIGDSAMESWPGQNGILDLTRESEQTQWLHAAIIALCDLFIGTTSGPSFIAPFLASKCLITNTTSIGRNTLYGLGHATYLPKVVRNANGMRVSLLNTLNSPAGFGELGLDELYRRGYTLQNNSDVEIRDAVVAQLDDMRFVGADGAVDRVRGIYGKFASSGRVCGTFIEKYPRWVEEG